MHLKSFFILLFVFTLLNLQGQNQGEQAFLTFGYTQIPLHIDRTDVTRWMIYPTFRAGYRINQKILIQGSYLGHDIRIKKYKGEDVRPYIEVPRLTSYELASMYLGKIFTLSLFSDYIFLGLQYEHYKTDIFNLRSEVELGYRFGETSVLSYITENPTWPNGYEVHSTILSSNSPGIKLSLSPKLIFWNIVSLELSVGSFVFNNWPSLQPFANAQIGLSF